MISFGREICGDLPSALRREWLVTNGIGGYASGTLAGVNTRRYHGLLVAALAPPVGRTVLVAGLAEFAVLDGRRYPLSSHEFRGGVVEPGGYRHLERFALDGMLPVWTYAVEDALVERRVWMARERNTTYVGYRLTRGDGPVALQVTPLVTRRDFHALRSGAGWHPDVRTAGSGITVRADGAVPYRVLAPRGRFTAAGTWWWNFLHREETARGLDDGEDLYAPGTFAYTLSRNEPVVLIATAEETGAEDTPDLDAEAALAEVRARQQALLRLADTERREPVVRQLTLAADQFIVRRGSGCSVLAGYHWFSDWGRDAMIAVPGLTLATGRLDDAAAILQTFAGSVRDGLLPNRFPDDAGAEAQYNTADASLWFVLATGAFAEAVRDRGTAEQRELSRDLRRAAGDVIDRYAAGTRYGIGMDPQDGLVHVGEPGVQLTWMDAKVGGTVVTQRAGKPVEINALWYNALRTAARMSDGGAEAERDEGLAARVRASFRARFVRPGRDSLSDVVDGPEGDDLSVRPNQIFAVSLPFPLLEGEVAAAVVRAVGRALLTTYGLRSLAPDAPAYRGTYEGDLVHRDHAYHQGTAWAWLLGPYAEAYHRVTGDAAGALGFLRPFAHHLSNGGIGTISEIFDGDAPHRPRGCIAQAWSVAEVLRVWRKLSE
ncbi:MAG TPA: amylo-alpha-1,6-glucosidase [bacterium]|nr:amylo-alpha-1,6-glucosidase [bacterium]